MEQESRMSGIVKRKKEKEQNERAMLINSLRIGLVACIITIMNLFLDLISLYADVTFLSVVVGMLFLLGLLYIFGNRFGEKLEKISNKKSLLRICEGITVSSIFGFVIERAFLPLAHKNDWNKAIATFMCVAFLVLSFFIIRNVMSRKDWRHNVDG